MISVNERSTPFKIVFSSVKNETLRKSLLLTRLSPNLSLRNVFVASHTHTGSSFISVRNRSLPPGELEMPVPKLTYRYICLITLSLGGLLVTTTTRAGSGARALPIGVKHMASLVTQEPPLPAQAMTRMTTYFENRRSSRYMEQNCVAASYPGWEDLPLKECTYSVKGSNDPVKKTAKVIMLNAEPDQLARWVVSTCIEVVGSATNKCTKAIGSQIIGQSGAQFPIAGIVFEDILPANGKYEVFAFRNGVTVRIHGVTHTRNSTTVRSRN